MTLAEIALGNVFFSRAKSRMFQEANVETILAQTTDEVLEQLFGKSSKSKIYRCLEKKFKLRKSEIATKPYIFSEGMASMFGSVSHLIEQSIMKVACKRMNLEVRSKSSFADYVATLTESRKKRK